jgi:hypothetical protein
MSAAVAGASKWWWLPPLLFTTVFIGGLTAASLVSETAREVLAKAFMFLAGAVSTPFILEITVAIIGLFVVVGINQWRMQKEGDGWVYLAVTEPDAASVAEGSATPPHRLDSVVLEQKPDLAEDFQGRIAIVEGYLELGLAREALEHLELLRPEERATERVKLLRMSAESRLA